MQPDPTRAAGKAALAVYQEIAQLYRCTSRRLGLFAGYIYRNSLAPILSGVFYKKMITLKLSICMEIRMHNNTAVN